MKKDWKSTIRDFLLPIQKEENPFSQIERVVQEVGNDVEKLATAVHNLENALKNDQSISFLVQQPHSEEVVRDYLYDVLAALKKVTPAPGGKSPSVFKSGQKLLIAVDFDGTIVEHQFPELGAPLPGAIETLRALSQAGHRLILFTCREDEMDGTGRRYLTEAMDFCKQNGINFLSANETPSNDDFRPQGGRKVYADVYIDDRNLGGFPGWDKIRSLLLGN